MHFDEKEPNNKRWRIFRRHTVAVVNIYNFNPGMTQL